MNAGWSDSSPPIRNPVPVGMSVTAADRESSTHGFQVS